MIATAFALAFLQDVPDARVYHQKMLDYGKALTTVTGEIEVTINSNKQTYKLAFMKPNFLKLQSGEVSYLCDGKTLRTEFVGVSCQDFEAPKDRCDAPFMFGLDGATNSHTLLKLTPTAKAETKDGVKIVRLTYKLPDIAAEQGSVSGRTLEIVVHEKTGAPHSWSVSHNDGSVSGVYKKLESNKPFKPDDFKLPGLQRKSTIGIGL